MKKSHYSETAYGRMRDRVSDRKKQHEVYSKAETETGTRISRVPYKTIMAFH